MNKNINKYVSKFLVLLVLIVMFSLSACGMKRALTMPDDVNNKAQADEKDLVEF